MHRFNASDGIGIHYRVDDFTPEWRPSRTAILLHAGMGSLKRWTPMVPAIARRFRTVRMDLRGHGDSQVPPDDAPLTLDRMTDDVRELMDHLEVREAHFICSATGGYLGQHLAVTSPERVRSLALFSSTPGMKSSGTAAWIPKIRKIGLRAFLEESVADRLPLERVDPAFAKWYVDEAAKNDTGFILRLLGLMSELDLTEALPLIRCPTLVVVPGTRSRPGGPYSVMGERVPDVKLVEVKNGHQGLCDSEPDRCAQLALDFLAERFPHD
jgi:pimeloyl-ACP methyl ester carboxylesterase